MHFSLLVAMFFCNLSFCCHSNQSNSAFWTKCIYSEEYYSSNISIKLLSTYLQWVRNKGILSFFPNHVGHLSPPHLHHLPVLLLQFCLIISRLYLGITTPEMMLWLLLWWCFTALRQILGHSGRGQLTYPHCSWANKHPPPPRQFTST